MYTATRLPSKLARPVDKAKRGFDGPAIPTGALCESSVKKSDDGAKKTDEKSTKTSEPD